MDSIAASVPTLQYLRGLPTRDGWVRPDPARAPLSACKRLSQAGALELRGGELGLIEVRLTADGLRALAEAPR